MITDPRRLERIVANLVANAIEHGRPPVGVRRPPGADRGGRNDGPGIPPDQIPRLFERFSKGDPARGGGTGLGLAIALENAQLLGGTMQAGAAEAGGTVRAPACDGTVTRRRSARCTAAPRWGRPDDPEGGAMKYLEQRS